jgi:para-aminobenzoate synthetase component 1
MKGHDNKDQIKKMNKWGELHLPFIFIFDFEMKRPLVLMLDKAAENGVYYSVGNLNNIDFQCTGKKSFSFQKFPVSYSEFTKAFELVIKEIKLGNSFLVNLTFVTCIETDLTLREIFCYSEAPYKLLYKDLFVVFSPEPFIKICAGEISSFPMKGTIDASIPDAETKVLNDIKEIAEHHTIVDLIRNDLSRVSDNVKVKKFRYMNTVATHEKTLLQVSSEVTGQLRDDYTRHMGDIVSAMLPAGSICGAPKKKTLEIIRKAENYDRGFYTGVFGIFDGKDLQSAVMIRYIEKYNGKLIFKSGGGITSCSDPEKEYQELIDKVYVPIY